MKKSYKINNYINITAVIIAFSIASFVLFYPPMPGVADQGDFQRVMTVTGLKELERTPEELNSLWFKFVKSEYKMVPMNPARLLGIIPTTSMIYPITLARIISGIIAGEYFSTKVLSFVYVLMYTAGFYFCYKFIKFKRIVTNIFFMILSIFILMDGNYVVWFNSLYGEPMMIIGLMLFIASALYAVSNLDKKDFRKIMLFFLTALLFLGAKLQCFPALPFMIAFIIRIAFIQNKDLFKIKNSRVLIVPVLILIFYVGGIYVQTSSVCGLDTEYNSVFYGILKNSKNPEKDLAVLGLPSDMAVDAGKHAYLPKEEYIKYKPWSKLTKTEFNDKISNFKLLKFYVFQPERLIEGMEYTASKVFDTMSSLGKYEKTAVSEYTYKFNRFTLWSEFRNTKLPKRLIFLVIFYGFIAVVSIIEYIKRKENTKERMYIELLWLIAIIGILQFPMPYIGNGEADTAKQLFLFNYTFDIMVLVSCTWIFDKVCKKAKNS
ncbi:hypothetical protein M2651_06915 [Clostridium sp. SYSU_GA19001]|uniref:glycan biosynthesis hexose transferase WsfD n=1 Tax=Clostridium caldaquaticum TaxID=2940653 RepID=UPI0020772A78|nr:hypothetical protein [Clostridium caldaquaticum]MCM8710758.1 hypothetical protein [Clostridium caldaquaticum]